VASSKLRPLVVDGDRYLWRLTHRVEKREGGGFTAEYSYVVYLAGRRLGRLEVRFSTWEAAIEGGPLHTGAPLEPGARSINLNHPVEAAALIRKARAAGWDPTARRAPFVIADGLPLLELAPA
jgi:hypothetical protein